MVSPAAVQRFLVLNVYTPPITPCDKGRVHLLPVAQLRSSNNSIALVSTSKGLFLSLFSITKIAIYTAPVEEKLSPEHSTQHGSY